MEKMTLTGVIVINGLFTGLTDFGPGVFTGATNWLQIGVATNSPSLPPGFTTLTPRQELTAIQGLNQKLNEKDAKIQKLKEKADRVDSLEKRLNELEQMVQSLAANK
ncbi:MAG: hypothetical protein ACLP2Y_15840 [Limisphaerales bacterium]